ncbi:hypothetical protein SynRS9909_01744 [Synechococcus sp. RS9909]|nr:hypothetical protein SynRS9909_01744 [Synechococcus sp. RS9909]
MCIHSSPATAARTNAVAFHVAQGRSLQELLIEEPPVSGKLSPL